MSRPAAAPSRDVGRPPGPAPDHAAEPGTGEVLVRRDGPVLHAVLSNPRRRNAITWAMYDQLLALGDQVAGDPSVRVLVLRGAGGAFAAGTDIHQFRELFAPDGDGGGAVSPGAVGVAYERRVGAVVDGLTRLDVPVLGVVEGPAVGAGLVLAAVCDVLVATPDAVFGVPVARTLGNCVPAAVVARLQSRLGAGRATAMLLTASLLGAEEARTAGFVHAVLAAGDLEAGVEDLVGRLAAGAPLSLAAFKELDRRLHAAVRDLPDEDVLARCYGSADFAEGVAAFTERRPPRWQGR